MKLSDYFYELPESAIAFYPPKSRGNTKLLTLNRATKEIKPDFYANLDQYLESGDVLVLNDTKVVPARLKGVKSTGGLVEIMILEKHGNETADKIMYRGKLKANDMIQVGEAKIIVKKILGNGLAEVSADIDLMELGEEKGEIPIPPYLKREEEQVDKERYQTLFAKNKGSVAAPTASLNFTNELKEKLLAKGVCITYLTLHVGLGTFLPIRTDNVEEHDIHSEYYFIPAETVEQIRFAKQKNKKVVALGTTVTRTLEFCAERILDNKEVGPLEGEAKIFIYPGYSFKLIDALITNFHAPESTVLMMAAAFAGWDLLSSAYSFALENEYKFLSYGDSMIIY